MSIRYPESLVKKNDQNPPVGYVKVTLGDLWSEKLLDTAGFTVVWHLWWLNDGFFLFLTFLVYSNRCEYDILKVLFEKIMPGPTLWVHHLLKCSALTKWPILHAILGHLSVRQRTCTCTFEVCKNVYLYMWEMYVKFQNLISTHRGLLGLPTIVETS